ncbi:MAG: MarP family serine protease [Candidatus Dormibacteraeota bacterium]|nr:MarP family serine protease [Candidatus Dormibacteraeota bacterium]
MNLLDLVIVALIFVALGNGYRRGFTLSSLSYLGLVVGLALGAVIAPPVERAFATGPTTGPYIALLMLFLAALIGSSIGYTAGEPIRLRVIRRRGGGRWDSVAGAAFSIFTVLASAWFLGLAFARGPIPPLTTAIERSAILRLLDTQFQGPPPFLSGVQQIIAGVPYPKVFDAIANPDLPGPVTVDPAVADNAAVVSAAHRTVKVRSVGCGGEVFGSGFPVADNYIISNAHVVAGTHSSRVLTPDGRNLSARVVLFDPQRDVSILLVPGLRLQPLAGGTAGRGTTGATIGYPGGGNEVVGAAAVRADLPADGRDIYGDARVRREIYVLTADIHPGNSGGPLVDAQGRALGVVFANSTNNPREGYALTDTEVAPDISHGVGRVDEAGTGSCAS